MLSEVASARLAAPVALTRSALRRGVGYDAARVSINFPTPWPGGPWRLRDIMDTTARRSTHSSTTPRAIGSPG